MLHGVIGTIEQFLPFAPALSLLNQAVAGPLFSGSLIDMIIVVCYFVVSLLFGFLARKALHDHLVESKESTNETLLS